MKILVSIFMFSFIIFFHELGHFLVAKRCHVRVNQFMIGLGPKLLAFQKGETEYSLRLLPFGGACVMEGEDKKSDDRRAFSNKPLWQKFLIVFAGPLFNFILAFLLSLIVVANVGYAPAIVDHVIEGSPGEEIGLKKGDHITKAGTKNIHSYRDLTAYVFFHEGQPLTLFFERDGKKYQKTVVPEQNEETGRYAVGVVMTAETKKASPLQTIQYAYYEVLYQIDTVLQSLKMIFQGKVGLQDLSGPVGIVKTVSDSYDTSIQYGVGTMILSMLSFAILLSANLGVMNLIPFPALDGGRIAIYAIEGVLRKKLNENVEGLINIIGFGALILLMICVLVSDIGKITQ